jgi:hypothetical protein
MITRAFLPGFRLLVAAPNRARVTATSGVMSTSGCSRSQPHAPTVPNLDVGRASEDPYFRGSGCCLASTYPASAGQIGHTFGHTSRAAGCG